MRIEALANDLAATRTLIDDRFNDYLKQVARTQAASDRDLADYRRLHERSLEMFEERAFERDAAVSRLERAAQDIASELEKTGRDFHAELSQLGEGVSAVKDSASESPDLGTIEELVEGLYGRVDSLENAMAEARTETINVGRAVGELVDLKSTLSTIDDRLGVIEEWLQESEEEGGYPGGRGYSGDLSAQLEVIAGEIEKLRRRIALRARTGPALDEEALDNLAGLIAERIGVTGQLAPTTNRRRRG